jgi:hypothetical protein
MKIALLSMQSSLPRPNHPLQPRLRIVSGRTVVKDGDAKPAAAIGAVDMRPAQKHREFADILKGGQARNLLIHIAETYERLALPQ